MRQSSVAILMIVWKTYKIIFRQAWPILLLYAFGKSGDNNVRVIIGLAVIAVAGMVYSIINYYRYYFYLRDDELIIESGVFKRKKLSITFDRIQTINFEQNIIHKIFDVVRLKIDTAGSSKEEFNFESIGEEKAEALRSLILKKKKSIKSSSEAISETSEDISKEELIFELDLLTLLKAGAVQNHLKSGGLILAFMLWIWQSLQEIDMQEAFENTVVENLQGGVLFFSALVVVFIIFSFAISLISTVVRHFDLKFSRIDKAFKIRGGLFTKKDISAKDQKIQMISWDDNLLMKLIGIKNLTLKQASSVNLSNKKSIKVPACKPEHIERVKEMLYGLRKFEALNFAPIDKRYFYRQSIIISLILLPIIGGLLYFELVFQGIAVVLVLMLIMLSLYLSFKKKSYAFNNDMLVINGGMYGDKTTILPIYKIQSIKKKQTPYQKRNNLANLIFYTASGSIGIPYIDTNVVDKAIDELLYKVEVSNKKWM